MDKPNKLSPLNPSKSSSNARAFPPYRPFTSTSSLSSSNSSGSSSYPPHTVLGMPALSPTMEKGVLRRWNVKKGQPFAAGDVIAEIETDKASIEYVTEDDGFVAALLVEEGGDDVEVGKPIMIVVEEEEDVGGFEGYEADEGGEGGGKGEGGTNGDRGKIEAQSTHQTQQQSPFNSPPSIPPEFILMPSARAMSSKLNVDGSSLYPGTGFKGRVTKGDVIRAVKEGRAEKVSKKDEEGQVEGVNDPQISSDKNERLDPSASSSYTVIPNSPIRKVIASRLTSSKDEVCHEYYSFRCDITSAMSTRRDLLDSYGVKVSLNDVIVKAVALSLTKNPSLNGNAETVDVSVAVATPTGLITPIIKSANTLTLSSISSTVRDLASRAREGKLMPEEYQGGTFTVSNLGMFGVSEFTAVINPPQVGIIAVGGGVDRYVKGDDGEVEKRVEIVVNVSVDGNRVEPSEVAKFGQDFVEFVERPKTMI